MNYFVSIESKTYFLWQIQLLIQSFKLKNLDDDLIIGIAKNNEPVLNEYSSNIVNHKNKFLHENYAQTKGCKYFNKFYSIILALNNGILKQPFALIHPDMLLYNPIENIKENFTFNATIEETFLKDKIKDDVKLILENRLQKNANWFSFGDVIVFNEVPIEFFYRTLEHLEILIKKYGINWNLQKAAMMLSFYEIYGKLKYEINNNLEISLLQENKEANFIHYKHGIPPVFSKLCYKYEGEFGYFAAADGPYKVLLEHNPNSTTNYVQNVINTII